MDGGLVSAVAFSVTDDASGAFYVVAFDRYGRPIHHHPLSRHLFADPRSAFAMIEGFAAASEPSASFVCPSDDAAE